MVSVVDFRHQTVNGRSSTDPPLLPDGSSPTASGRYCGSSAPASVATTDRFLRVTFVSDASGNGQGFSLTFNQVSIACGGEH